MKYAVEELGIKRFIATCDTENEPSRRVMERLGMTLKEERGGRRNKLSPEERREYLYGIEL
jgi:RimJ/RimL family protein N-acetyltransferase